MGAVNLTNLTGGTVTLDKFSINKTSIGGGVNNIKYPNTVMLHYNEKKCSEFSSLIIEVTLNNSKYKIDLNKDHYFYGNAYQYPGEESDIDIVMFGTNNSGSQIQLRLSYCQEETYYLTASSDYKYMDKQSS